jgi:hypothetical protein
MLDYEPAFSPSSPIWTFSDTPGFGPQQWAMEGTTWPEAWDRFNDMVVTSDPIGNSLELDGELQLMIGLPTLVSYDYAEVILEGRSRSTNASADFDVTNPIVFGCGVSGTMSNDWDPDIISLDFGQCLVPGETLQAVRVSPNGTLALLRMTVILHGAVYY